MKREYTYETGIACDPNKKNSEEDEIADGYIDYQNQEMVLANGDRIDLGGIGKNKARRPAGNVPNGYRNLCASDDDAGGWGERVSTEWI